MGFKVRYNGTSKTLINRKLAQWQQEGRLVVLCPEVAAGLPVPRLPAEIVGGSGSEVLTGDAQIIENNLRDVSQDYLRGAQLALEAAQQHQCDFALLTDGSPTCGSSTIYNGRFAGEKRVGEGVAAALLRQHGIEVFPEHHIAQLIIRLAQAERCDV